MKQFSKKFKSRFTIISTIIVLAVCILALLAYNFGLTEILFVPHLPSHEQVKIACVGDSVTYGYGLKDWEHTNYPAVLQSKLGQDYHTMRT